MKKTPFTRHAFLMLGLLAAYSAPSHAQLWREFAHSATPHEVTYDIPITITELLDGTTDVIELPVLVVLLEFSDVTHQSVHTPIFYNDFVFGTGNGEWTANHLSVKQIFEANSNGRLVVVPAVESHGTSNDGIVGWVTTECLSGIAGSLCVGGSRANQSCDPADASNCPDGGHCEICDSWEYYRWEDRKKRAEAIRRADAFVNYADYDTRDRFWNAGTDGIVRSNELAVVVIHARPDCQDHHGHSNWGLEACTGGTMRPTDAADVNLDGKQVHQHPGVIPEANTADVLAHELAHETFGLADLYSVGTSSCNPVVRTATGSICYPCPLDSQACNDTCGAAACLEDMVEFESPGWKNVGATTNSTGTDITDCGVGDTKDVWFTYTPSYSDNVVLSLCDSACTFDTTLAVFDSCGGAQLAGACNDDFTCSTNCTQLSRLTLAMEAETTYFIRVSGHAGTTGTFKLEVTGGGGVCNYPRDSKWSPQPSGFFSMMSNQSTYEPHLDPWAKIHLGFVKPQVVTQDGTYTLYDAETARSFAQQDTRPEALVIYDPRRPDPFSEYFIVENRNVIAADGVTPVESGLAIWLIHENPFPGAGSLEPRRAIQLIRRGVWALNEHTLWDGADPDYYDLTPTSEPKNTNWTDGSASFIEFLDISTAGPTMTLQIRVPGLFVDAANTGFENGTQRAPYNTVEEGLAVVSAAGGRKTIRISGGSYQVANPIISTPCTLASWRNGPVSIRK